MSNTRWLYIIIGLLGLLTVYFFQAYLDFYSIIFKFQLPEKLSYATSDIQQVETIPFVVNKVFRYIINDLCAIAIIHGLFKEKKYVRFSFYVLLFGLIVLLPAYIGIYLARPVGFSSMLTHLHRLVMNPVLMMLLIPAFYYQRHIENQKLS